MSGIILSSSVRQNLLSLQSTADLLSTTQNRLATGKKVNSALDNPTNFFTAAGLDARASDINNLLDGISNGVQILQAANTGITSLNKLVDTAKSIASQVLQTPVGFASKSNVSTKISGATPDDLRGTTSYANTVASSNVLYSGAAGGTTAATGATTLGSAAAGSFTGAVVTDNSAANITASTLIYGASGALTTLANTKFVDGDTFTVNGKTITVRAAATPAAAGLGAPSSETGNVVNDGSGNSTIYLNAATTVGDYLNAIDIASGAKTIASVTNGVATLAGTGSTITGGAISLVTTTGGDLSASGKADVLKALGLTAATGPGNATVTANRITTAGSLNTLISDGATLNVNGKIITFKNAAVPAAGVFHPGISGNVETDGSGNSTVYLQGGTINDVLKAVDLATGVQTATLAAGGATLATSAGSANSSISASGALKLSTGLLSDLSISGTGNALGAFGLAGNTGTATVFTAARNAGFGGISGKTLTFSSFKGGTPVNITFGDGSNGTVKTLAQLNAALYSNNLTATLDANSQLVITSSNDYASATLGSIADGGVIGGTVTTALTFSNATPPVADVSSQATRANLVAQYNNVITQITTTSQDASFNGVNLLAGDTLKLVFNETGRSTLTITGAALTPAGLGLPTLASGTDFIDNASANKTLAALSNASTTLRAQASALGSNLSIVQIRQEFAKNLINVLQTGSSNLTLADTNEEAANSQALATRQSIAVSALALANQSQQSVLQLLR